MLSCTSGERFSSTHSSLNTCQMVGHSARGSMGGLCLRLRVSGGRAIGFVQHVACFVLGEPTNVAVVGLHDLMRMAHM